MQEACVSSCCQTPTIPSLCESSAITIMDPSLGKMPWPTAFVHAHSYLWLSIIENQTRYVEEVFLGRTISLVHFETYANKQQRSLQYSNASTLVHLRQPQTSSVASCIARLCSHLSP